MKRRRTIGNTLFDSINVTLLTLFFLAVLYPCLYVVSSSFSSVAAVQSGSVTIFPIGFNLKGYDAVFQNDSVWLGYKNSAIYTFLGTVISLILTTIMAYPLSRKDYAPRNWLMGILVFTMYFGGGLIPTYILFRATGIMDNVWVMVLPGAVSAWNVILMRTFYQTNIPESLLEASQLDGCSDLRFLVRIVLPLSKPILAVIGLYAAVALWNSYFQALVFLRSPDLQPLQIILRRILIMNQIDVKTLARIDPKQRESIQAAQNLLKFSLIVVATLPILAIYPFVQKYFVKGVMIGALKG